MEPYPPGFEECERLRSDYIRHLTLQQLERARGSATSSGTETASIPKKLIRYWHNPNDLPEDVRVCLDSWERLRVEDFEFHTFDDYSAATYIADMYGERELKAFQRCTHPAMRCDYLRMCFVLAEGGLYVDADDVLLGDNWRLIFRNGRLKVQPLCYDITTRGMLPAAQIWQIDLPTDGRIFYVNNDPIAAPANHPVLRRALVRATNKLLADEARHEIQSTTGPGNFTTALAAHARHIELADLPCDFELLRDWNAIAETRWELSYRGDDRNWRNVFGC